MPRRTLPRRRFLQSLGVSTALAPFIPLLESEAGGKENPTRFLLLYTPHGTVHDHWEPDEAPGSPFALKKILQPLAPHQDYLNIIGGLAMRPHGPPGGNHTVGPAYVSTGSPMLEGTQFEHQAVGTPHGWNSGPSIDQAIADHIGNETAFKSLRLGVQGGGGLHPGGVISYRGPNEPLPPQNNPQTVFSTLFGETGIDPSDALKLRADRLSIIDIIKPELESLQPKVSAADKFKIDAHLEGIWEIEQRLTTTFECSEPDLGGVHGIYDYDATAELTAQQIRLLTTAFGCGATRVASLMMRRGENDNAPYPNLGILDSHHSTSHLQDEASQDTLSDIYQWYASQLAEIVQQLRDIPEGDGSVFDNTVIAWVSEVSVGWNHSIENMPFVVMGGSNVIRGNQYLRYEGENHCRLLTALGQAMGLPIDAYGGFDDGSGPITDFLL